MALKVVGSIPIARPTIHIALSAWGTLPAMWFWYAILFAALWALCNVLDSMVVRRYAPHPFMLMWMWGLFKLIPLSVLPFLLDVTTPWALPLLLMGSVNFGAVVVYIRVIERIDISIANAAWAVEAMFLSLAGFVLFQESWTLLQTTGALCILTGMVFISFWHRHVSLRRTLLLLGILGIVFIPEEILRKAALEQGQTVIAVLFWSALGGAMAALIFPWFRGRFGRDLCAFVARTDRGFYLAQVAVLILYFSALASTILAYQRGPISLVNIVGSTQPFFAMFWAFFLLRFLPAYVPKELLTFQSVRIKLLGFLIVTAGLALLAPA